MATPAVGKDVDSFCGKCKMLLNHVVVAKVGDTIKRVKCLTCGSEHTHRAEGAKSASGARAKSAAKLTTTPKSSDYDALLKGRDLTKAKKYKPTVVFAKHDVVDHAHFGIGIVLIEKDGNKIDVAFKGGVKTLAHHLE